MERFYAIHNTPIFLGYQGEEDVREVVFDISPWAEAFGPGEVQLFARRAGEEVLYPVPLREEGAQLIWAVTAGDVGVVGQSGECELSYIPVVGGLVKSEVWATTVLPSLDGEVVDAPAGAQSWIDTQRKAIAANQGIADKAAKSAAESAESAGIAATRAKAAEQSAKTAEEATRAVAKMVVSAETLPTGAEARADVQLIDGAYHITIGVPEGKDGSTGKAGADGKDGSDGFSPIVSVTPIDGGHRVSITDADGTKVFDVMDGEDGTGGGGSGADGKDGKDGVSVASVTQTTTSADDGGYNVITVTLSDGTTSYFTVRNGSKGSAGAAGKDGEDGYTPVKGVDYFDGKDGDAGKDGSNGKDGADGKDATINGVNALTIQTDGNISATMNGSVLTLGLAKVPNTSQSAVITLSASGWTEQSNGRFTQNASVSFMTADAPVVNWDVYLSGADVDADDTMEEAYLGNVYRVVPGDGSVTVWAREVPDVNIQMTVGVS